MQQVARNVTMAEVGFLNGCRYLLHDRDTKFSSGFERILACAGVESVRLTARSPNLNAICERWIRSAKEECLSKLILFGERSLRNSLEQYVIPHQHERNHQGQIGQVAGMNEAIVIEADSDPLGDRQRAYLLLGAVNRALAETGL